MLIKLPTKNNSKNTINIVIYSTTAIIILFYIYTQLPFFSNSNAFQYLSKNYPKMIVRYEQMGTTDFLRLIQDALKAKLHTKLKQPFNQSSLPTININIKFNAWEKIKQQRSDMIGRVFMRELQEYQKATIQIDNRSIPVKIRLKGGRTDHITKNNRWSLRVKTKKGKMLFGMKVFSLQHPQTRGFQREAVFHDLARKKGLLALKYIYVNVSINGEPQGIMAVEEVPSKLMLEREQVKEGLIYQLDDINVRRMYHSVLNHYIDEDPSLEPSLSLSSPSKLYKGHYNRISRIYYNSLNAPIKEITRKKKGINYERQRPIAVGLLKAVREGKITPSSVFDAEKTGLFYAYLALWGDTHNASFRNSRYYFNPYTLKFEPIVYDSNAYGSRHNQLYPYRSTFRDHELNRILLSDPLILNSYLTFIKKFLALSQQDDFEKIIREIEKQHLSQLRNEFWLLPKLNLSSMKESISFIQNQVNSKKLFEVELEKINDISDPSPLKIPKNFNMPTILNVDFINLKKLDQHYLEIHNFFPLHAKIIGLTVELDGKKIDIEQYTDEVFPYKVKPFYYNTFYSTQKIKLVNLPSFKDIRISGQVILDTQTNITYNFLAQKSYPTLTQHPLKSQSVSQIINNYPFIRHDINTRQFKIQKGHWTINHFIIFPQNSSLIIPAGTTLKFSDNAGMLLKGSLHINGSKKLPVILDSISNKKNSWLGISIMNTHQPSTINYAVIKNTNFTKKNDWELTGGINFYKADIDINHSLFENTKAEDALNIVNSNFKIRDLTINNTISDGFDSDFSKGTILNSHFSNIGGDAVDFSGSDIHLKNSSFLNIHDKAISVGEESNVLAENITINNSGTGIAVKDSSQGEIISSEFKNIKHSALMSYTKKKFFAPSTLKAKNITYDKNPMTLIAQGQNKLIIDGEAITPVKIDIDAFYSDGYMKK